MARAASFGFCAILGTAIFVSGCGRQVTPNPPGLGAGGAPPGYIALFFTVGSTFNFSNYQYLFVFNTTGNGVTPSTDTQQTNWAGYSNAVVAQGNGQISDARFAQIFRSVIGKGPPTWFYPRTTPQQLSYNLDSNGTSTEFSVLVQKAIFNPTPGPSPAPSPSNKWSFNAFTIEPSFGQYYFIDSLGAGGPTDPQYVSPTLCMTEPFDSIYRPQGNYMAPDPSAQIVQVEIANNPAHPSLCP